MSAARSPASGPKSPDELEVTLQPFELLNVFGARRLLPFGADELVVSSPGSLELSSPVPSSADRDGWRIHEVTSPHLQSSPRRQEAARSIESNGFPHRSLL